MNSDEWIKFFKEPRILLLIVSVVLAIIAIHPTFVKASNGKMEIKTNLKFGFDIKGGVQALLEPADQNASVVDKAISVLQNRLDAYGLKQIIIRKVKIGNKYYIEVEVAGMNEKDLKALLAKQGKFEAMIPFPVQLSNGKSVLSFDNERYEVKVLSLENQTVQFIYPNNKTIILRPNQTFMIKDVPFKYMNVTNSTAFFFAIVYTGSDIKYIYKDVQNSRVEPAPNGGYKFIFAIATTKQSAKRFAEVTRNLKPVYKGQECYLNRKIYLFIDNKLMDSLNIDCDLRGEVLTRPYITGYGKTRQEALDKMKRLQSILEGGALPTKIKIVRIDSVSPILGESFMKAAFLAIILAIICVSLIMFVRYRNPKLVIPIILTLLSELIIILGIAAVIGWSIDLASIAGILAIIGSGVDDQIVITDEAIHGEKEEKIVRSLKQRLKNAFTIIMTSAAALTAAMIPLMSMSGISLMKGFAFTTIIGVWIGVLITRPSYSKIVEYVLKKNE